MLYNDRSKAPFNLRHHSVIDPVVYAFSNSVIIVFIECSIRFLDRLLPCVNNGNSIPVVFETEKLY